MVTQDTRRICRSGERETADDAKDRRNGEVREIVDESVKQWQPKHDEVVSDDERW